MKKAGNPTALVFGVNGQDGSLAAENLLERGFRVVGVGRQAASRWIDDGQDGFGYIEADLEESSSAGKLVLDLGPDLVLYFAAAHGPAGFDERRMSKAIFAVNLQSAISALEAVAQLGTGGRYLYASSSHVFGLPTPPRVDVKTQMRPQGLYGISKNAATQAIARYRERYGVHASVIHFFNHESSRKGCDYFIPRLVAGLSAALADERSVTTFSSLDFSCDWGCAREYMDLAIDFALTASPGEQIMATGVSMTGRDLAERLFSSHGLDYRRHINSLEDGETGHPFTVNLDPLRRAIGRTPKRSIMDVCKEMLERLKPTGGQP